MLTNLLKCNLFSSQMTTSNIFDSPHIVGVELFYLLFFGGFPISLDIIYKFLVFTFLLILIFPPYSRCVFILLFKVSVKYMPSGV